MVNTVKSNQTGTSDDTKTIVTVILLVFIYPIGMIMMWVWTRWPVWVKILLTLPLILFVLGIIAAITLVSVNPSKQSALADSTKRKSDIQAIANAIYKYKTDHGLLPSGITEIEQNISYNGANICSDLVTSYLPALPVDPKASNRNVAITDCTSAYNTEYSIVKDANNEVTVSAPLAD